MSRTLLAIAGLVTFFFGAYGASAFTTYPVDPVSHSTARPTRVNFRTRCRTGNLGVRLSACRAGCPVGSSFNFQDHRRATTPRTAHSSSSQVRYSCRASIGRSARSPGASSPAQVLASGSTCGKLTSHRSQRRPNAAETLGSFTARYAILYRRLKP